MAINILKFSTTHNINLLLTWIPRCAEQAAHAITHREDISDWSINPSLTLSTGAFLTLIVLPAILTLPSTTLILFSGALTLLALTLLLNTVGTITSFGATLHCA